MPDGHDVLSWQPIGDLHITRETEQKYLERGIEGTQLGPNRNGRKW